MYAKLGGGGLHVKYYEFLIFSFTNTYINVFS